MYVCNTRPNHTLTYTSGYQSVNQITSRENQSKRNKGTLLQKHVEHCGVSQCSCIQTFHIHVGLFKLV